MKQTRFYILALLCITALVFSGCDKDDTDKPAYVGKWASKIYKAQDPSGGTIDNKMAFTFTETNFNTEVFIVALGTEVPLLGIRGDIEEKPNNILKVELTDLGQFDQDKGVYNWKNRVDDEVEFNGIYNALVVNAMPKDFDAKYEIEGNKLDLIIEVANDTIHLFK